MDRPLWAGLRIRSEAMMRVRWGAMIGTAMLIACAGLSFGNELPHLDLRVRLEPKVHEIRVRAEIRLPDDLMRDRAPTFVLHEGLRVTGSDSPWALEAKPDPRRYGLDAGNFTGTRVPLREYRLVRSTGNGPDDGVLRVTYRGRIHHPLVEKAEEYGHSFSHTPGTIGERGVVLSDSTAWRPLVGESLVTFRLDIDLPAGWDAVSQGSRTWHETEKGRSKVVWASPEPMDDVYLVAARFTEYLRSAGEVMALAFLRRPDPSLASKYLEATVQYLKLYRKLIGPYPYDKFALVENFWDTGYGMPSFTLLGPKIIRFPFTLHSSYPHEILHNWWGHSVFVDWERGNWCEGLTAYLADHLVKEGHGQGAAYRRDTLKRYRNFVRDEQDFPLTEFRARYSQATEAVGYGKSLMLWHMLRRRLGDETFVEGLRRFYRANRFRRASFSDLEKAFSNAQGRSLEPFFRQWVERVGAPELRLESVLTRDLGEGETALRVGLRQIRSGEPYRLSVPVAVTLEGEPETRLFTAEMDGRQATLKVRLPARPLRVDVDPEFDLFRRLDPREIPPSLGQMFGAERVTIVLPDVPHKIPIADWKGFAQLWAGEDARQVEVVAAGEIDALPDDRAVWILGRLNRWAASVLPELKDRGAGVDGSSIRTSEMVLPRADHCYAFIVRHPEDDDLALGWIGADRPASLPGFARKLPHYGKYSFVVFSGDEPTKVAKGQWPVPDSPLVWILDESAVTAAAHPRREPLARPGI